MIVQIEHNGQLICADAAHATEAERQAVKAALGDRIRAAFKLMYQGLEEQALEEQAIKDEKVAQWCEC